jgi:hypothetical protein
MQSIDIPGSRWVFALVTLLIRARIRIVAGAIGSGAAPNAKRLSDRCAIT